MKNEINQKACIQSQTNSNFYWKLKIQYTSFSICQQFSMKFVSIVYNPYISMGRQFMNLLTLASLIIQAHLINITSLLVDSTIHFLNISEAYLTLEAHNIYLLQKNVENDNAQLVKYSIAKEGLTAQKTFFSSNLYSNYWQLTDVQQELISFSIQTQENAEFYDKNNLITLNIIPEYTIFRFIWVRSQKIAYLSTVKGEVGYATLDQIKQGSLTLIENSHHIGSTFISLSPNQHYVCSTDIITGLASIWDISNKVLLKQLWLDEKGILTHSWNLNSSFLYLVGCETGIVYKVSVNDNFTIVAHFQTYIPYILSSFHNFETNELVAIAYNHSQLLIINLDSGAINQISLDFIPVKLRIDDSQKYFAAFSNSYLSLFKVNSICDDSQYFHQLTQNCISCPYGCSSCDQFTCYSCRSDFVFNQNQTICEEKPTVYSIISQITADMASATLLAINQTINVPGHRQFLNVFFQLFSNFDHFLLYIYHNRTFGANMQKILWQIHDTVDYRFQIINKDICSNSLGMNFSEMKSRIDFKVNYSHSKYVDTQQNGQGFFEANLQYFFLNIPLVIVMLIIYHVIYKVLSCFRFSLFLQRFTLWGLIILLLLEGNIEFFYFSFTGDFLSLFSTNYQLKILNVGTILMAFIILMLSTLGIFSIYLIYRKKSRKLYQNCSGGWTSAMFYVLFNGIFNIMRGVIHRSAINTPQMQVLLLFLLESTQVIVILVYWRKIKIFKSSYTTVLIISGSISRAFFNLSFLLDSQISIEMLDNIHISIIAVNLITFLLAIVQNIYEIVITFKQMYSNKVAHHKVVTFAKNSSFAEYVIDKNHEKASKCKDLGGQFIKKRWMSKPEIQKKVNFKFCRQIPGKTLTIQKISNKIEQQLVNRQQIDSINLQ